jgi:hypothetical protein
MGDIDGARADIFCSFVRSTKRIRCRFLSYDFYFRFCLVGGDFDFAMTANIRSTKIRAWDM